jgi:uncharacterized hydrophobic protein (TIGR00271 family)
VLHLRLSLHEDRSEPIGRRLEGIPGISRVLSARTPSQPEVVLTADVEPGSADELLRVLGDLKVGTHEYVLTRLDVVAPITADRLQVQEHDPGFAWLEVLGEARANARPLSRYLVLMAIAGLIAALGVIESNAVLIVGAMAVSPDLLPVCALSVGLVARRWSLVRNSLGTLLIGLTLIAVVAASLTLMLELTGLLEEGFDVENSSISDLAANADYSTVLVALAAGVAAMLSFETRASAAVGVAISVTTIPASAYLGVALGAGDSSEGLGALLVLAVNVALLIVSGTATLFVQRYAGARQRKRGESPGG